MLLEDAQDVGDLVAAVGAGAAPADHDPLADIGRCEPDLKPVAHTCHLTPSSASRAAVSCARCSGMSSPQRLSMSCRVIQGPAVDSLMVS
jgi:hypothetical protein